MNKVVLLSRDLLFQTKVAGTARALGSTVAVVGGVDELIANVPGDLSLVMIDLSPPTTIDADGIAALKKALPAKTVLLAFGSHVDIERLEMARQAGCELVMARSEFVRRLPRLVAATGAGDST